MLVQLRGEKGSQAGSLLVGVCGSWLGGCIFWGWLRANPMWHIPVESFALPLALGGLETRWRVGSGFYLACLLGTACTDLMILLTGVMQKWPDVVLASLEDAPKLLSDAAADLCNPQAVTLLLISGFLIASLARYMRQKAFQYPLSADAWLVASAALTTTLWIDGLFFITALIQPKLSGLI